MEKKIVYLIFDCIGNRIRTKNNWINLYEVNNYRNELLSFTNRNECDKFINSYHFINSCSYGIKLETY